MHISLPFLKKKEDKVYYFCLYITDSMLSGFVLDVADGKELILASRKQSLSAGYDKLLEDIDTLISELELQSKVRLEKTIFFLNSNMIDSSTHDIKDPYKQEIKKICRELELEPLGYIDLKESMEDYVRAKAISNCIIIELNKSELGVFIYRGSALIQSQYVVRTPDIGADISSALSKNTGTQILPSKILIYGEADNAKAVADIAQYNWDQKLFVQHPTIETLKDEELNLCLSHSFANELGETNAEPVYDEALEEEVTAASGSSGNSFGFVVGEDVLVTDNKITEHSTDNKDGKSGKEMMNSAVNKLSSITKASSALLKQKGAVGLAGAVAVMLSVFFGYEYFFHKATLKVYVQSKNISENLDITMPVSETSGSDVSLLKHVSVMELKDEKTTTGTRDEGEKAKGNVIIHNFDNAERTLQRGTEIKYKNLIFTLDSDVKVASSSGVTGDGTKKSGKKEVAVTASEIGPEYNLDKGTQFTVDSLPESLFIAIADSAFTGGSKKKVNTVSKQDIETLESKVSKEAKNKSKDQLSKEISKDEILIPKLTSVTIADASYSKELGEEADVLGIQASSEIEYYTVNKDELSKKMKEELSKEKTEGFKLDEDSIEFEVDDVDINDDEATLTLQTKAKLIKKVDDTALKSSITMKSISSLADSLGKEYPVTDVEVETIKPNVPFINSWTPLFKKNITVITTSL